MSYSGVVIVKEDKNVEEFGDLAARREDARQLPLEPNIAPINSNLNAEIL